MTSVCLPIPHRGSKDPTITLWWRESALCPSERSDCVKRLYQSNSETFNISWCCQVGSGSTKSDSIVVGTLLRRLHWPYPSHHQDEAESPGLPSWRDTSQPIHSGLSQWSESTKTRNFIRSAPLAYGTRPWCRRPSSSTIKDNQSDVEWNTCFFRHRIKWRVRSLIGYAVAVSSPLIPFCTEERRTIRKKLERGSVIGN